MRAILHSPQHPEYGSVTVPLPIPREDYRDGRLCPKEAVPVFVTLSKKSVEILKEL